MNEKVVTKKCVSCGEEMQPARKVPFRTGGLDGGLAWLLPGLSHLDEQTIRLDSFFCPKCGRIDFFANGEALSFLRRDPSLYRTKEEYKEALASTPRGYLKSCPNCREAIPLAAEDCPFCNSKQE